MARANAIVPTEPGALPALVRDAAARLAKAETAAEVLDVCNDANQIYHAAKNAARLAKATEAHAIVVNAAHQAMGDATVIEAAAKVRLADEYDAAQENGAAQNQGRPKKRSEASTFFDSEALEELRVTGGSMGERLGVESPARLREIDGLTKQEIHEARQIRDAEQADPGVVERTVKEILDEGGEPTKAAVNARVLPKLKGSPGKPPMTDEVVWLWGRMRDFERDGYFDNPVEDYLNMTDAMKADLLRLVPRVMNFLTQLEEKLKCPSI